MKNKTMWFRNKLLLLLKSDNAIYQLLLVGLFIASPSLHYLCYYGSYDPLWLRIGNAGICLAALLISFFPRKLFAAISQYAAIVSILAVNNFLLLTDVTR